MAVRRSLTTTTAAAGAVLIALCFVPTASATPAGPTGPAATAAHPATAASATGTGAATTPSTRIAQAPNGLADTGAVDTTPYLVGGAGFLGVGAALLLGARRRAAAPEV